MPIASFVILTFNSQNHIEKLISSLMTSFPKQFKEKNYEIIVVDNNSSDKTRDILLKYKTKIKIIENQSNYGFSKGINIGAQSASGEFLIFINPDSEFKTGDFLQVFSLFDKKDVGVVGGKILKPNGVPEKSAGKFFNTFNTLLMALSLDEVFGVRFSPTKIRDADFVSGGFMIVRSSIFRELGGFDENLFMYVEDMEFCFRVKKRGFRVLFDPEISIIHEAHGSSNKSFAIERIYRGLLYFQKKHGNFLSYSSVNILLKSKALSLVMLGKIINNKYLKDTYIKALKA